MGEMIEDEARQAAAAVLPDGFAVDLHRLVTALGAGTDER